MVDKIKNTLQSVKGRGRQTTGRATGDRGMEARGRSEKTRASLKRAGANIKAAFR
jgi:uncharacterized protein YjbJ (UPF0337 family)